MGKVVFRGQVGSKAVIGGTQLLPGQELSLPFAAIPEGCLSSDDYEVYDDGGELISKKAKVKEKVESEETDEKARVGGVRTSSSKKKKKE